MVITLKNDDFYISSVRSLQGSKNLAFNRHPVIFNLSYHCSANSLVHITVQNTAIFCLTLPESSLGSHCGSLLETVNLLTSPHLNGAPNLALFCLTQISLSSPRRGLRGRVVTLSPPTSEIGVWFPI